MSLDFRLAGIISNFLLLPEAALPLVELMSISELFSDDAVDDDFCPIDFKAELNEDQHRAVTEIASTLTAAGLGQSTCVSIGGEGVQQLFRQYDRDNDGGGLAEQFSVRAIPTTYLIGRDGNLAASNLRGHALEIAVAGALKQKD